MTEIFAFFENFGELWIGGVWGMIETTDAGLALPDERSAEDELFRSLGGDYSCIFRVNLAQNSVESFHLSGSVQQKYGSFVKNVGNYSHLMSAYIQKHTDTSERGRLIHLLTPEILSKYLETNKSLLCECHETRQGIRLCHRIKVARLGQSKTDVVVGIVYALNADEAHENFQLHSNRLLVVGESELADILRPVYDVEYVQTPEEAMQRLTGSEKAFAAVVTEQSLELVHCLRTDARYRLTPVIVATDPGQESRCLGEGASEVITRPYQRDVVKNRVRALISLQESASMLHILERDPMTGLYTKEFFFRHAEEIRRISNREPYILACISIENYRVIEEKYGNSVSDLVAEYCARQIHSRIPGLAIAGRLSDDCFIVMCNDFPVKNRENVLYQVRHEAPVPNLVVKIGTVRVDEETSMRVLCDHAQSAVNKIRQIYGVYFEEYSDALRQEKLREQRIIDSMEKALEQHQFQVYYQPKHLSSTGRPVGAEALVRWNHPDYGFMNPGEFIPLFERIGFIRSLDRYVWTQVGKDINRWKEQGLPLVPVSINLSRRDFESPNLADDILNLMEELKLEPQMIHIELTESAFTENPKRISDCLARLHKANFVIELDDFGAGYSSLTTLNSLDLDVLKIDMSIIRQDKPGTQRNALEFCMELAKMMNLETVAEGIETETQVDRVRSLGCDYIQGYYYSKPVPVDEFERYMARYSAQVAE